MAIIGRRNSLPIIRASTPGLYLDGGELGEILLPGRYIPRDLAPKDRLDVFIYRDSEDRLVATTETPFAMVGEFACLQVVDVDPRAGAFLDWGLAKDLLLPFREQTHPVRLGQRVVVYLYLDPKSDRIVASAQLRRHVSPLPPSYRAGQAVNLFIVSRTPLGYNAIVEGAHFGLLFHDQHAAPLAVGEWLKGFVRGVRPDGKIDLSLNAAGYQRVASLTEQIVETLLAHEGRLDLDDDSPPEAIRATFGVSKKAYKQALGALYRVRRIEFTNPGIRLANSPPAPPPAGSQSRRP